MENLGSCHCGNIRLNVSTLPTEATQCNCSLCRRYAGLWAYYEPDEIAIHDQNTLKSVYSWGDRDIEYHRCHNCGCVTHYVTTKKCPIRRIAVNLRMADPVLLEGVTIRQVDGAAF